MRSAALVLTLAVILSQPLTAQAHEHGTGRLEILFSEAELSLSLAVPATEIVDFEMPAESDEDRASVAVAISDLSKPLELFVLSEQAMCVTTSANVALSTNGQGADGGNALAGDQGHHTEFQADYQIQCQNPQAIDAIQFAFFTRFPQADKLIVQIGRSGETHTRDITRTTPVLSF
ncbi:ZrgA family zinc uptake protein [Ruegeria halocynthiae]|uniref:ZrgA family zinc uptake protein n=1 Tax=Ruegeria halocynthiae TaxID=985054 RepID=UPI0006898D8E|nr:DUF2796 domain-containing protein [Ruegeria halocynthiae]